MDYTMLGETGLEVSRLCLGCANFGSGTQPDGEWHWTNDDEERSRAVIDGAIDAGINYLDTANMYSNGESEGVVSRAIEGRRDELVIATKVGGPMADRPNGEGLSRKHIIEQVHRSLERLGTDYIDVYQLHVWDEETPIEETLSALDQLVDEGIVRYVGASNARAWQLVKALYTSDVEGYERFVSMQPEYNLVSRDIETDLLPACDDQGLGVVTYSPLAAGFFAGRFDRDADVDPDSRLGPLWDRLDTPENWATYDRVVEVADRNEATPVQIATAWVLHQESVTAPIIGPSTVDELEEYLGALDITLSADDLAYLEGPLDESG